MTRAEELKNAILKSMGKEDDPIGILVEAVLKKEFDSYDEILKDCKGHMTSKTHSTHHTRDLIRKIENKISSNSSD